MTGNTTPDKTALTGKHALMLAGGAAVLVLPASVAIALRADSWAWVWALPGTVFCLAFGVAVILFVLKDRKWIWAIERATDFDWNKDGAIGKPPENEDQQEPVFVPVYDGGKTMRARKQAMDFKAWIDAIYDGTPTTWDAWRNERLPGGAKLQQEQWQTWCDRLIKAGLAERPYPTATLELKGSKRLALAAFREYWTRL